MPATYTTYWNVAQKKGYAGTAIFTRTRPVRVTCGIGCAEHDCEGRVLAANILISSWSTFTSQFQARIDPAHLSATMGP